MSGSTTISLGLAAHSMYSKMSSHITLHTESTTTMRSIANKRALSSMSVDMNT